jgi:2-dehydro-3-deoxyphosphogalactonate aldolase
MTVSKSAQELQTRLNRMPLIAILRGVQPHEVIAICANLVEVGFEIIEIPLNSPQPYKSIEMAVNAFGDAALVGAGTVLSPAAVAELASAGGQLVVMPHADPAVISYALERGLAVAPGVATPSEAFAALSAGAHALKMFPAEVLGVKSLRAWSAVLPADTALIPVGGVTPENLAEYHNAGAAGFGIGSALYKPGFGAAEVRARAELFVGAARALAKPPNPKMPALE